MQAFGTSARVAKAPTSSAEEALGQMWFRTTFAPQEHRDLLSSLAPSQPVRFENEPKLKAQNTFLNFKLQGLESQLGRRRSSSDAEVAYYSCLGTSEPLCKNHMVDDDDASLDTLSTGATDNRSRSSSFALDLDEPVVDDTSCSGIADKSLPRDEFDCGSSPSVTRVSLTKPPGTFALAIAPQKQVPNADQALVAMKMAHGCDTVSQLAVAALRAEVEAAEQDKVQSSRARISKKKAFSISMAEKLAEQRHCSMQGAAGEHTTIQFRRLPVSYTRAKLITTLNAEGFRGCFDFVYLPIYFESGANFSYAFVNLVSPAHAERMMSHFEGFSHWIGHIDAEPCEVVWTGPFQGLMEHVERYRNSPVMHFSVPDEHKPVLFSEQGIRIPFPAPTRVIRPPRARRSMP